ncbi:ATP-binding cassette domain-containing protein [Alkalimarinus sediminis]|uniref:ATP-binding cassette domain-containing protein n=1 Tax=Alkalimarinus sediminis TaxID=1632866 RepID=A0A9E8HHR9_9ALTE|nr:ATP-binding cassette domain-containing protein [Alkalimarinus sediminis]UZW74908.1 ATP-binding cassette domain-containing protein [Alkalimarinus sediminis]
MLNISQLKIAREGRVLSYELKLAEGKVLAIQGVSGVGKSTLLSAIAGFVEPLAGTINWNDEPLNHLPVEGRPVSYLFQDHNLFEHLSVIENLSLGFAGPAPKDELIAAASELKVLEQLEKRPGKLSGGQRQRIALIRTLLRPEPLILLDEPFAELDPETRHLTVNWVKKTAKANGKTVLMVTHQAEDAEQLADECLILEGATSN